MNTGFRNTKDVNIMIRPAPKANIKPIKKELLLEYQETKEKLEKLKRETESQDTRLLKIQNQARQAEDDYAKTRKDIEIKLADLSKRTQVYLEKQKEANEFLNKNEQAVLKSEARRTQELERWKLLEKQRKQIEVEIAEADVKLKEKKDKHEELKLKIEKYRRYEEFLKLVAAVSDEGLSNPEGNEKDNTGVKSLISRFEKIKTHQKNFAEKHKGIQEEKEKMLSDLITQITQKQNQYLVNNSDIPKLIEQLDKLQNENHKLEEELDKREFDANRKRAKYGAIIFGIKNLYVSVKTYKQEIETTGTNNQMKEFNEKEIWQTTNSKKLLEYLETIQEKLNNLSQLRKEVEDILNQKKKNANH